MFASRRNILPKLAGATALVLLIIFYSSGLVSLPQLDFYLSSEVPLSRFFEGLEKYQIDAPLLKDSYKTEKAQSKAYTQNEFLFSKEYLENVLNVPQETFDKMKASHHGFVNDFIPRLIKSAKLDTFGTLRHSSLKWKHYKESRGYVLIGGGKYSWLSYLVVKQIRKTGSSLPIEVFIPSVAEYEEKFCDEVLPKYNARCNLLDDTLAKKLKEDFHLGGYQFKMLAILTSQFENVLYMDSDLFPTNKVDYLFSSELYKEKGLILWPDHWARTTNPKFFEIAGRPVVEKKIAFSEYDKTHSDVSGGQLRALKDYTFKDSNFHDFENALPDPTTEAGVFLVNKSSHLRTLLLAMYYNLNGPNFYYPLMTQGGAGEGDKETFIAAATIMGEPYFQTRKHFKWVGYHNKDEDKFVSKGLGHYDPITSTEDDSSAPIVFMHCSYPKYYTDWFYNNHDLIYKDGKEHIRMYSDIYSNVGYDFDLRLQQFYVQGVCRNYYVNGKAIDADLSEEEEWAGNFLKYIGNDVESLNKKCDEVYLPHLKWLKETTKAIKIESGTSAKKTPM